MPSNHCHSAVDVQGLPGDVGGLVAGEIGDRRGDVRPGAQAGPSSTSARMPSRCLSFSACVIGDLDEAGRDDVDGDVAARATSAASALDMPIRPGLGGGVVALPGIAGRRRRLEPIETMRP